MSSTSLTVDDRRFEFGANWKRFLTVLQDEHILQAENSFKKMLHRRSFQGLSFLDIGSGSGLSSLVARRLGMSVFSFDYDQDSVHCTKYLRESYCSGDEEWKISQGSVLDREFCDRLGQYDVVYSWGVLHHTGRMWEAFENVIPLVKEGGDLFIAIYNDQGTPTRLWSRVKKIYCSGWVGKSLVCSTFIPYFFLRNLVVDLLKMKSPARRYREYKKDRGMSLFYDWFDWLGGYPFEVAKPEEIFDFFSARGFLLQKLETRGADHGCNQFVFKKTGMA